MNFLVETAGDYKIVGRSMVVWERRAGGQYGHFLTVQSGRLTVRSCGTVPGVGFLKAKEFVFLSALCRSS